MKEITTKRVTPTEIIEDGAEEPLNLTVFPNYMGINICNINYVEWDKQADGQFKELRINFCPSDEKRYPQKGTERTLSVNQCSSCGQDHKGLKFVRVDEDTHKCPCPITGRTLFATDIHRDWGVVDTAVAEDCHE